MDRPTASSPLDGKHLPAFSNPEDSGGAPARSHPAPLLTGPAAWGERLAAWGSLARGPLMGSGVPASASWAGPAGQAPGAQTCPDFNGRRERLRVGPVSTRSLLHKESSLRPDARFSRRNVWSGS